MAPQRQVKTCDVFGSKLKGDKVKAKAAKIAYMLHLICSGNPMLLQHITYTVWYMAGFDVIRLIPLIFNRLRKGYCWSAI